MITRPIIQMRKLKPREANTLALGHTGCGRAGISPRQRSRYHGLTHHTSALLPRRLRDIFAQTHHSHKQHGHSLHPGAPDSQTPHLHGPCLNLLVSNRKPSPIPGSLPHPRTPQRPALTSSWPGLPSKLTPTHPAPPRVPSSMEGTPSPC